MQPPPQPQRVLVGLTAPTFACVAVVLLASCVGPGLLTDGSSVSFGKTHRGALRNGAQLPPRGVGYMVPRRWRDRDRSYGTDEMVALLVRATRTVARRYRRSLLGIADISPREGGKTKEHASHQAGRDVDIIYYAKDKRGRPVRPLLMVAYNGRGESVPPKPKKDQAANGSPAAGASKQSSPPAAGAGRGSSSATKKEKYDPKDPIEPKYTPRLFDTARNWALIRALVTDHQVRVQWIFIGRALKRMLLRYAKRRRAPKWLLARADAVMHQPGDSANHMDHMHVRIYCSPSDRHQGCHDWGPPRWLKKTIKYGDQPPAPLPAAVARLSLALHGLPTM